MRESEHYQDGLFVNLMPTQVSTPTPQSTSAWSDWIFPPVGKNPSDPLPSLRFDRERLSDGKFAWLGHSTLLINTAGMTIMTDPVFNRASPIPFGGFPFAMEQSTTIDDFPSIDAVIISHDHYDHLDHRAIKDLASRVEQFYVPLGIKAYLQRWGIDENKVIEFD